MLYCMTPTASPRAPDPVQSLSQGMWWDAGARGRNTGSGGRGELKNQTPPGTCPGALKSGRRGYGTSVKSTPVTACELLTQTLSRTPS